jgi:hypothetical protein
MRRTIGPNPIRRDWFIEFGWLTTGWVSFAGPRRGIAEVSVVRQFWLAACTAKPEPLQVITSRSCGGRGLFMGTC